MPVELKDIKVWAVAKGISHVVAAQVVAGTYTVCGSLFVGDWRRKTRTGRLCTKCVARLEDASLITKGKA